MKTYKQIDATKNAAGLPVFIETKNFSVYLDTETEKYDFIRATRQAGAVVTGVSGCGAGYYIQIQATAAQAETINKIVYTREIHNMNAATVWQAWKTQKITMGQLAIWQERHKIYFDPDGNATTDGGAPA